MGDNLTKKCFELRYIITQKCEHKESYMESKQNDNNMVGSQNSEDRASISSISFGENSSTLRFYSKLKDSRFLTTSWGCSSSPTSSNKLVDEESFKVETETQMVSLEKAKEYLKRRVACEMEIKCLRKKLPAEMRGHKVWIEERAKRLCGSRDN